MKGGSLQIATPETAGIGTAAARVNRSPASAAEARLDAD